MPGLGGAYSPEETYSVGDLKALAEFALEHGVRVMPEVDFPAHALAGWDQYKDLVVRAPRICRWIFTKNTASTDSHSRRFSHF